MPWETGGDAWRKHHGQSGDSGTERKMRGRIFIVVFMGRNGQGRGSRCSLASLNYFGGGYL